MSNSPNKLLVIGAFFSIYIIWGSTYLVNALGVQEVPPFFWAGARFILSALVIFLLLFLLKIPIKTTRIELKNALIAGVMFLTIGNGLMCWALQYIDSGMMSLMVAAQPLLIILMLWIVDKQVPKWMSILGCLLGMLGMYLLINQSNFINTRNEVIGLIIVFVCLIFWGIASLFVARVPIPQNQFLNTGIQMGIGGICLMIISLFIEDVSMDTYYNSSPMMIPSMIYLVIFGSVIAFTSFNYLLQHVSPEKVSTSTYINPIVALFLGWYFNNEVITGRTLVAASILFIGVYFINSQRYQNKIK